MFKRKTVEDVTNPQNRLTVAPVPPLEGDLTAVKEVEISRNDFRHNISVTS